MRKHKLLLSGSITVYVLLLLGIIIGLYLFGNTSPFMSFISEQISGQNITQPFESGSIIDMIVSGIGSAFNSLIDYAGSHPWQTALIGGFAVVTGGVLSVGYGVAGVVSFFVPTFLLVVFANVFFFPITSYTGGSGGLPFPLNLLMTVILNTLMLLAILEFVRGGD